MPGPLLFKIDLIDLCLECEDDNVDSYADDTTPYSCAGDHIKKLEEHIKKIFTTVNKKILMLLIVLPIKGF